jgi:hypothetical protein
MENRILISRASLEFMTRTLLEFWECDSLDLTIATDRKIAIALDEAISELELQEEFDTARAAVVEANRLAWEAKQKSNKS